MDKCYKHGTLLPFKPIMPPPLFSPEERPLTFDLQKRDRYQEVCVDCILEKVIMEMFCND